MTIFRTALACLLVTGMAAAQANNNGPVLKPRANTPVQDLPIMESNSKVPPDAPVITIRGVCDKPVGAGTAEADCKTVITRAEFERVINAVQPNMPKAAQKQFASRYVIALLLADRAHRQGLDRGPEFDEQMNLARLQVLAKMGGEQLQKEAANASESDIQNYYQQHAGDFKTITYEKIYVPKQKQSDTAGVKPDDPELQKKREASQEEMKAEAGKLRARAAGGEDFVKLQQEAYDLAGMKLTASKTRVEKVRKSAIVPASDAAIFDLKKGEVSQVFDDPQGFMIYKVEDFQDLTLPEVHDEIARVLQNEKLKAASDALQKSATTEAAYDDAYFAAPPPPTLRNPGEAAPQSTPKPAPAPPGKK
ncbi:MAG TPA: peptidylprolyl isomerase [Terriglobales bacterium]|nr:peptidylprolyl isomerase [Terriglobales bacterium]